MERIEQFLSLSDLTLLGKFKNGSEGQDDFYKFMRLVRSLQKELNEKESYVKFIPGGYYRGMD